MNNLDRICIQLKEENKTYAQWQKERYVSLYDVRSHIKQYKRVAKMQRRLGYKVRYGYTFRVVGKIERGDKQ